MRIRGGDAELDRQVRIAKHGIGAWLDEPDHVEFRHAGFVCLIHRAPLGHLCGYVGVPPGHPWHAKDYDAVHEACDELSVHGGLTYSRECSPPLCHVPEPGEPEHLWWLGFDCAHSGDYSPGMYRDNVWLGHETYKNLAYVRAETERLAEQAKERA